MPISFQGAAYPPDPARLTVDNTFSGQMQLASTQAATDANSAMSRGLGDARYTQFLDNIVSLQLPPNSFSSTTPLSGSVGVVFGSSRGCFMSVTSANNARVWANHFPGIGVNYLNTGTQGFNAQNPFTIIIPVSKVSAGANTRAWLRFGSSSAFMVDYSSVEPSGVDTPSIGWVITRVTTTEFDMRLYTWNGTTLNYGTTVTVTDSINNNPRFIILSGNGTTLRLRVVNRLRQVILDTTLPTIPLTGYAIGSLGLINNGTGQAGDLNIMGCITVLPYEIQS